MIVAPNPALDQADDSWRDRALCRETDPELFFPIGTTGHAEGTIEQAKRICSGCAVVSECLDYALATNQDSGIWGGLSEEERRDIRRRIAARNKALKAAQVNNAGAAAS
jgi:WhiB family redox-sensing transcriptional regulator